MVNLKYLIKFFGRTINSYVGRPKNLIYDNVVVRLLANNCWLMQLTIELTIVVTPVLDWSDYEPTPTIQ